MKWLKEITNLLVPYTCLLCQGPSSRNQDLCQSCFAELPVPHHFCQRCAIPLPNDISLCGQCLKKPPAFAVVHSLFLYEYPITKLILDLKFKQALVNARVLGELLASQIQNKWYLNQALPQLIIPIPLHARRLKERGFNQALEIARPIAKSLPISLEINSCFRHKDTCPQAMLSANERELNIKRAFSTTRMFNHEHIAVVDDVMTTGNTLLEFCDALKKQGAGQIDIWCCARPSLG